MELEFTEEELTSIATALAGNDPWDNEIITAVKKKIKDAFLSEPLPQCCYCARPFVGEFRMQIDIEHVLPKSKFATETFVIQNLNISCKRCNMQIKKEDTRFLTNLETMGTDYYRSEHYDLIHPNLDPYADHILIQVLRNGNVIFTKYVIKTKGKGQYTYDYFRLKDLEIDNLNTSQGLPPSAILSEQIPAEIRSQAAAILGEFRNG